MTAKEAEQCIKEVFGPDTKVFIREDLISQKKRVLRPPVDDEKTTFETFVLLGSGKLWEDAVRMAITPELMRRQHEARIRAANAEYAGERFAVFLREKFDHEYNHWIHTSPTAAKMQKDFEDRMGVKHEETAGSC